MISDKNDKIFVECWDFNLENTNKTNFIASGILEIKNIDLSIIDKNYRFFEYKSHNYVIKSQNLLRESFGH